MTTPISQERRLFNMFAPAVAYITVQDGNNNPSIGTCFHIGENVFITARHVVEGQKVTNIGRTIGTTDIMLGSYLPGSTKQIEGPFYHPKPEYDLAAIRVSGLSAPQIPFLDVREELNEHQLMLRPVLILGFPPIPGTTAPVLLSATAEVNTSSFVTYFDKQPVFIVSGMARGGFSGAPALTPPHHCLGVVTRSILKVPQPPELGFMAVVGPWPVLELLDHHQIMPQYLRKEMWNGRHKRTSN